MTSSPRQRPSILRRTTARMAAAGLVLLLAAGPAPAQNRRAGPVAVIAHPGVPVDGLSFSQLRKVFLGDQQYWPNRERITLLVRAPEAYERDVVLRRIYEMSEGQFRQYWIAKIFRSEMTSGPKIVYSTDMAHELVTALPGSVTFMRATDVRSGDKVLRIDGRLPGEGGYPLQ